MTWTPPQDYPSLADAKQIAIDCETNDPHLRENGGGPKREGYIVGVAIATDTGFRGYYPVRHATGSNLPQGHVFGWLREELSRPNQPKLGANLLYDLEHLDAVGVRVAGPHWDVQNAEPLLDENKFTYSLDSLGLQYCGEGKDDKALVYACLQRGIKKDFKKYLWQLPPSAVGAYAEKDVDLPLRIFEKQRARLEADGMWDLFLMESDLIPQLLEMRKQGIPFDVQGAKSLSYKMAQDLKESESTLATIAGRSLNANSGGEIAEACDRLGLYYERNPKTKNPTFGDRWLQKQTHELFAGIRQVRKLKKLKNDFVDMLLKTHIDGRIYYQLHQLKRADDSGTRGTGIGRFSCSDPNIQQIPKRDEAYGKLIRCLFPSTKGLWARFDYSQIEPRISLHFGRGPIAEELQDRYRQNPNLDCYNLMLDACPTNVTRDQIKQAWLGSIYGMGVDKLADTLYMTMQEAESFQQDFFNGAPYIKDLSNRAAKAVDTRGYVQTVLRRRRHFDLWEPIKVEYDKYGKRKRYAALPEDKAITKWGTRIKRAGAYRAIQSVVSGSAADTIKKAMVDLHRAGVYDVLGYPLITVHDELCYDCADTKETREAFKEVSSIMEKAIEFRVPQLAEVELGKTWGSAE